MLKFKNLTIKYKNKILIDNFHFNINKGEIVVISGKSGCGKSTFLKAINGILNESQEATIEGSIKFNNEEILSKTITQRSKFISTVFQNPKTQFYCINTTDELAFALENRNIKREDILSTISFYTGLLNTKHLLNRNIFSLSGGQKQIVAITAVSCMDNDIYLFDEPSASLDKKSINLLKDTLIKLKKMGKIIIIAEHRLYYLRDIMDKFIIIDNSKAHFINNINDTSCTNSNFHLRTFKEISKDELQYKNYTIVNLNQGKNYNVENYMLECKNFVVNYNKTNIIDVTTTFPAGINFIIGDNGIGKTTFIKKLCRLVKGKGDSFYNTKKIKKSYDYISMVMQDVNYQLFTESVWQEISIVSDNEQLKIKTLKELDLYEKREFHPQILSGGEKQRLLIALAKVSTKPIIILDEPTSGLCRCQMLKIIDYIHEMERSGKIIIIITHDYEFINQCGGNIYEFIKT